MAKRIECRLYKIPAHRSESKGLAERMVQTVKIGLKAFDHARDDIDSYLPRLLRYRSIPHAGRVDSPSAMMGKQIRSLKTMSYSTNGKMWYKNHNDAPPERANYVMQRERQTALINENENVLAHTDQIKSRIEEADVDMKE